MFGVDLGVIAIVCGCCFGFLLLSGVLSLGLNILGIFFDVFGVIIDLTTGLFGGGPGGCCGCLALLFILAGCGVLIFGVSDILSTCGTPDAVNLCRLVP